MPRTPRPLYDRGTYHIVFRGNNRLAIFDIEGGVDYFMRCLRLAKRKFSWKLYHYCIMNNHVHLLIEIERGSNLPKLMQFLLLKYSLWYRRQTGYVGYLWQGRYKSFVIEDDSYFIECGRYIERNPVRAGIVNDPKKYSYSSYLHYAFGKADPLIDDDPYYRGLGRDLLARQQNYRELVKIERPYDGVLDGAIARTLARKCRSFRDGESVRETWLLEKRSQY